MVDVTLSLPGLSPVCTKPLEVSFHGGAMSFDGGLLVFREFEDRLHVTERLAACLEDRRNLP